MQISKKIISTSQTFSGTKLLTESISGSDISKIAGLIKGLDITDDKKGELLKLYCNLWEKNLQIVEKDMLNSASLLRLKREHLLQSSKLESRLKSLETQMILKQATAPMPGASQSSGDRDIKGIVCILIEKIGIIEKYFQEREERLSSMIQEKLSEQDSMISRIQSQVIQKLSQQSLIDSAEIPKLRASLDALTKKLEEMESANQQSSESVDDLIAWRKNIRAGLQTFRGAIRSANATFSRGGSAKGWNENIGLRHGMNSTLSFAEKFG